VSTHGTLNELLRSSGEGSAISRPNLADRQAKRLPYNA
jgi:hypothetical protein